LKKENLKMKNMRWIAVSVLGLVVLIYPLIAGAQEEAKEAYRLDTMVVSATRTEIPAVDVPQSVTVLTSEQLMASPFDRVEDLLRSVPGMYNFRHYALQTNGIYSPLKMRGVGNNRLLVLVDGVPQNDNFNNAIAWVAWGHIPKHVIERIEIVRGPASALYGSEGLGGVVHIITKNPSRDPKTLLDAQAGTADTFGGTAFHSQTVNDLGFLIAGGYESSDGFFMVDNPAAYEIKRHRDAGKLMGKVNYDLTPDSNISLSALVYDHETGKGRQFFYDELSLDQYWLNYTGKVGDTDIKGLVYLNRADKTAFQDSANDNYTSLLRQEEMPATVWGADFQTTLALGDTTGLTLGAAYKQASWDYDDIYVASTRKVGADGSQQFVSPFANLDLRFLEERVIVNLGGRYDWIETSDGANWDTTGSAGKPAYDNTFDSSSEGSFSPTAGITWHLDDKTTVRASGGKGFRAPSLFELYKVHVRGGGTYYREANPNLDPEELWSYDIGVERFLTDALWGRLTLYQSFAKDYIGDRLTGTAKFAGGTKTRYEYILDNISEVDIHGVEAELEWYASRTLTLFANYAYNVSEVKKDDNNAALVGNQLPNDPRHNAHFGFRYTNPEIVNLSVAANYYGDIYFDNENTLNENGYFTVDASVSRKLVDHVTVFVNAENLFDENYAMFRSQGQQDTIAPGLIVTAGVRLEF
jgi:outer membrane receptor for ferrienterochelin and colicin